MAPWILTAWMLPCYCGNVASWCEPGLQVIIWMQWQITSATHNHICTPHHQFSFDAKTQRKIHTSLLYTLLMVAGEKNWTEQHFDNNKSYFHIKSYQTFNVQYYERMRMMFSKIMPLKDFIYQPTYCSLLKKAIVHGPLVYRF